MAIKTRYLYLINYLLPLGDLIALNALYVLAGYLWAGTPGDLTEEPAKNHLIVCNLIWLFATAAMRVYAVDGDQKVEKLYRLTAISLLLHILMFGVYLHFSKTGLLTLEFAWVFYVLFCIGIMLSRLLGSTIYRAFLHTDKYNTKVAILGSNGTAIRFSSFVQEQRNLDFYGFLGQDDSIFDKDSNEMAAEIAREFGRAADHGVTDVYVAVPPERMGDADILIREADRYCVRVKFIPDLSSAMPSSYKMSYIGNEFPVLTLRNEPLEELSNRFLKRLFDFLFSISVIILIFSWLFPILAALIRLNSKGPVFFKQLRSGRNDRPFWCYKFRTMYVNEFSDSRQAGKGDSRVTAIGRFLRRTSLDELPQFLNVLMGDMSVIGPRPHMLKHTSQYKEVINQFMVRHFLKPGITGWAQVNGYRGETREDKDMENRVRFDIFYLENWTVMMDLKIVYKTLANIWKGEDNAY